MKFFTILLLIVVGIVVVYLVWPAKYADGKNWVDQQVGGLKSTINNTQNNSDNTIYTYNPPVDNTTVVNDSHSVPVILKNACNYTDYGKPNYDGTTKAGQGCDTAYSQNDLTCIANPPKNYDGTIDRINQESHPAMTCCMTDGTCQWQS